MGLGLNLVVRVPNPLLGNVNLLGNLNIVSTKSHRTYKVLNLNVVKGQMHIKIFYGNEC